MLDTRLPEQWVRPYGDTLDDGRMQLSFTLPVALDETSKEGAKRLAALMGLEEPAVVHAEDMGQGFSFYIVYGQCKHQVDLSSLQVAKPDYEVLDKAGVDALIERTMGRRMVVIGACIETDAHTVGIDAIMNMKGFNGHKGLESYHQIRAINLGAQVDSEDLVARAIEEQADVILVSQVVTQKNIHLDNLTKLGDLLILCHPRMDGAQNHARVAFGASPSRGRHQRPGQAGSALTAWPACSYRAPWKTEMITSSEITSLIRLRISAHDAHYAGNLVDGAKMLHLFGDVATELLIRSDGDEGLFVAYDSVEFLAPVHAGDYIEASGRIVSMGKSSRKMVFEARKVIASADLAGQPSAADVLSEPLVVCRASGTCVVPAACQRSNKE